jgi:alpha-aminoadipate carrier protein LysW
MQPGTADGYRLPARFTTVDGCEPRFFYRTKRRKTEISFGRLNMSECVVCGSELELENDIVAGELVDCDDCGSELEIASISPIAIQEAPTEEEDWGE